MSLINKMLQDLDARGGSGEAGAGQQDVKAVPAGERDRRPLLLGGVAVGVLVLAAGGWYGWQAWQAHSAPAGPVPKVLDNRIPDRPRKDPVPTGPAPADALAAHASSAPASPADAVSIASGADAPASAHAASERADVPSAGHAPNNRSVVVAPADARVPAGKPAADAVDGRLTASVASAADSNGASGARAASRSGAPLPGDASGSHAGHAAAQSASAAHGDADGSSSAKPKQSKPARAVATTADGVEGVNVTPKQMSENSYRRALQALQEGRVNAALTELDKAVEIDPRNDAARQTYVSLLLENKRNDDAIRQLRLALGIDPRQPGLAMVLARLQLEKGGPALDTLLNTLPYAANSAEYQAFLAGVLQREQRHTEAAQHYRDALSIAPNNAVWWMGLGISLQADQHLPEAREAYKQARSLGGLTPELKTFIDRKLDQLSR
ncbi:tetratricopeptide repeat protein [Duganella sp. FT80W]|uniref:Tetratricopeptide repeat protein n=1 Tax=Duganella guangzhouensis TaxID=2666084 RepID=A0A6I2L7G8_9BURK|nr:tetratricopeptide repeat protein [Duganella guangzhouensis]MRW93592.1 tetratricopeptide repeat protein [Duganella guangzhouensis]